jgi:hypothetical protein
LAPPDFENLLAFLEETPEVIRSLTENLPVRELRRKPAKEEFSFLEHVCHLRDIEQEGYTVRIARLLSEEQPFLTDIDGDRLAKERNYNSQSFDEALSAFAHARKNSMQTIRPLPPESLNRIGVFQNVGTITLEELLSMMREHDNEHLSALSNLRSQVTKRGFWMAYAPAETQESSISRTVDTHPAKLRQKIEDDSSDAKHIITALVWTTNTKSE